MFRMLKAVVALAGLVALCQVGAVASGSRAPSPSSPAMSPEEIAVQAYNSGIDHSDKGAKLELQALECRRQGSRQGHGEGEEGVRERAQGLQARDRQLAEACTRPSTAWASPIARPATTRRRSRITTRRSRCSRGSPTRIEYRGEAYLGLNRIDDAKQAYLDAVRQRPKQADVLMTAMKNGSSSARRIRPASIPRRCRRSRSGSRNAASSRS